MGRERKFTGKCQYEPQGQYRQAPCDMPATHRIMYEHAPPPEARVPYFTCALHAGRPVVKHYHGKAYELQEKGRFLVYDGSVFENADEKIRVTGATENRVDFLWSKVKEEQRISRWDFLGILMQGSFVQVR